MKTFIGKYYKTLKQAIIAYNKMAEDLKEHQSLCEIEGGYFIVGNDTIKAFNKKQYAKK